MIKKKQVKEDFDDWTNENLPQLPFPDEPLWYQLRSLQEWDYPYPIPQSNKSRGGIVKEGRPGIILSRGYLLKDGTDVEYNYENAPVLYIFATTNPFEILRTLISRKIRQLNQNYIKIQVDNSQICSGGKTRWISTTDHQPSIFISDKLIDDFQMYEICALNIRNSVITWNEDTVTPEDIVTGGNYIGDISSRATSILLDGVKKFLSRDSRLSVIEAECKNRYSDDKKDEEYLKKWRVSKNTQTLTSSYIKRGKGKMIAESSSDTFLIPKARYLIMSNEEEGEMGSRKMKQKTANRERVSKSSDDYRVLNEDISPEARAELNRKWKEHFGEPRVRVFRTVEDSDAFMDEVSKFLDDFWEEYDGRQE